MDVGGPGVGGLPLPWPLAKTTQRSRSHGCLPQDKDTMTLVNSSYQPIFLLIFCCTIQARPPAWPPGKGGSRQQGVEQVLK